MRIECPGCDATYEVPEAQMRPGRSVRCVRCEVQWRPAGELSQPFMAPSPSGPLDERPAGHDDVAVPEGPAIAEDPDLAGARNTGHDEPVRDGVVRLRQSGVPAPLAMPSEPAAQGVAASVQKLATWRMGWMASLILLGGLLASAAYWRMAIMRDWPPSIRLYSALGARPPTT